MRKGSLTVFTSLFIALVSAATRASAESDLSADLKITWSAPSGCPDEASVRASIASLLRADATKNRAAPSFEAIVRRTDEQFNLTVRVRSSSGQEEKHMHGETCSTVADAFALVVAFAIDPNLAAREAPTVVPAPEPRIADPGPPETPASNDAPAPAALSSNAPSSEPIPIGVGIVGSVAAGSLPFPALGLGGVLAFGRRPRWELGATYWPNRRTDPSSLAGRASVEVRLVAARTSACLPVVRDSRVELCSSIEAGRMAAESSGQITSTGSGQSWWLSLAAGIALDMPVARAAYIRVRLDVGAALLRPKFFIDRPSVPVEAWRPSPVFAILSVEPELRLSPKGK